MRVKDNGATTLVWLWNRWALQFVHVQRQHCCGSVAGRNTRCRGAPDEMVADDPVRSWGNSMFEQGDWRVRAACRDENPDQLFVRGAEQRKARMVCFGCPVRTECLG